MSSGSSLYVVCQILEIGRQLVQIPLFTKEYLNQIDYHETIISHSQNFDNIDNIIGKVFFQETQNKRQEISIEFLK